MNRLWPVATLVFLHCQAGQAVPLTDSYAGEYSGTFTSNGATQVAATGFVSFERYGGCQIRLHSRPGGLHPNGLQWRDYNLGGGPIHNGHFHMAFVSGQAVEPVTFVGDKLIAVVQGSSGGAFILHKVEHQNKQ